MIVLSSTDSIRVVTTSANAVDVVAAHAVNAAAAFTPTPQATAIAAAATTTVVTAPAATTQANISHLSFRAKGGANTLTVQFFNGTAFEIVSVALASGERLEYENGKGWSTYDAAGQFKQSIAAAAGSVALTALATQAANTIVANATAGVASPTAVAVSAQGVLARGSGNLADTTAAASTAFTRGAAGDLQFQKLELATLATQAANTFVVNATGGVAAPTAVAPGAQGILLQAAANIVAATASAGQLLQRTVAGGNLGFSAQELGTTSLAAAIVANAAATNATTNLSCTGAPNILAGSTVVGSTFVPKGWFSFLHTAAATPTITAEVLVNAAVVATAILSPVSTAATFGGKVEGIVTIRTTGAGGTAMAQVGFDNNFFLANTIDNSVNTATFAIDTTVARSLELRIRMTTAVAANTLTVTNGYIERIS